MSHKSEEARAWYGDPTVSKAALRLMGLDPSVVVPPTFSLVWDRPDHREVLAQLPQAYSVVSNPTIQWNKSGRSPARSIENDELIQVLSEDPLADVGMSLRPKRQIVEKEHAHPPDIVCFLDIEHFDNSDPGRVLADQLGVFREVEAVYRITQKVLDSYQIPSLVAVSGRGYHFYFRVRGGTPAMEGLKTIGSAIEPEILHRHQSDHYQCKRPYPIETVVEQVFKGSCLVQQLLALEIQSQCQKNGVTTVFSDLGEKGIIIDNTSLLRHMGTAFVMIPPALWIKAILKPEKYGGETVVQNTALIRRLPRALTGVGEEHDLERVIHARQDFNMAKDFLESFGGRIPDASVGVAELVDSYNRSPLAALQKQLDEFSQIDPPEKWPGTYRNYGAIAYQHPSIAEYLHHPYPSLLQPEHLYVFINTLADADWLPIHILGLLQAIYTDPYIDWERGFQRHNVKERQAWGWLIIILSQALINR